MEARFSIFTLGRGLLVIPKSTELEVYDDLVNSVMLAQLVASKKLEQDPEVDWYASYVGVLDDFWLRQSRRRQDVRVSPAWSKSLFEWMVEVMNVVVPDAPEYLNTTLRQVLASTALTELPGSVQSDCAAAVVADPPSTSAAQVRRVLWLILVPQSPTSFSSVFVEFKTRQQSDFDPWQRFQTDKVEGAVTLRFAQASLCEFLFQPARRAIALKVKDRLDASLRPLDAFAISRSGEVQS